MKYRWPMALVLACFLLIAAALQSCGYGGTEIGNPSGSQDPGSDSPSIEDDFTPTPSPEDGPRFDEGKN